MDIAQIVEQGDAHPPAPSGPLQPTLCDISEVARLLGISRAHACKLNSTGLLPSPMRLGRRTLWSRAELVDWIAAGVPSRDRWETMRQVGR